MLSMRICLATRRYPVVTETFVVDSASALRRGGHHVSIVARRRGADPDRRTSGFDPVIVGGFHTWSARIGSILSRPGGWAADVCHLRRQVSSPITAAWDASYRSRLGVVSRSDCLLAHFGYVAVDWLPVGVLAGRRFAAYFHGSDITRWLRRDPHLYDALFASAAGLLTNSEFLRDTLVAAGADACRTRVVPLAAHSEFAASQAPPSLTRPSMVTVARLVEKKGVDDAIAAFASACRVISADWRYLIIGDGPERPRLQRLARRTGVGDRVDFVRRATRTEIRQALTESSIYVQSSRTASNGDMEGTPISLLEAATVGLPIVATAHAGIPELLPPEATAGGWLVAERGVPALCEAMVRLASSHDERRRWGRSCMALARTRTHEREARELVDALEAVARVPA